MCASIKKQPPESNPKVEAARLAYADALMIIPQTLAESAGMDVMDVSVKMANDPTLGIDVNNMELSIMEVYEPLTVVKTAMSSAVENGVSLLRTHAIIMAKPIQEIFGERADD
jgi:chaperonin GroEL (HSP60 family)